MIQVGSICRIAVLWFLVAFSVRAQTTDGGLQWHLRYLATWKSDTSGNFLMKDPHSICADPSGFLYVADTGNHRILKWSPNGTVLAEIGGFGWGTEQLDGPVSVWAKNGLDVLVADMNNQRIVRYDRDLHYISELRSSETWPEKLRFGFPLDAALGAQSELFCLDGDNRRVLKIDVFGNPQVSFGDFDEGEGRLGKPSKFCIVENSRILVTDDESSSIKVFDVLGNYLFTFGVGIVKQPAGMSDLARGWLLVADRLEKQILVFRDLRQFEGRYSFPGEAWGDPVDIASWKNRIYVLDKKRAAIDLLEWTLSL